MTSEKQTMQGIGQNAHQRTVFDSTVIGFGLIRLVMNSEWLRPTVVHCKKEKKKSKKKVYLPDNFLLCVRSFLLKIDELQRASTVFDVYETYIFS